MNLYLVKRTDKVKWGQYAGMVISGESEEDVRFEHPLQTTLSRIVWNPEEEVWEKHTEADEWYPRDDWAAPDTLEVRLIGVAVDTIAKHFVLLTDYKED